MRACVKQEGQCTLTSGAQLITFDGASGEILYSGAYEVASLCDIHTHAWFRVVVDVKECSDGDVMAGAAVYVFFRDAFIAINKNKEAWVRSPDLILLVMWVGASPLPTTQFGVLTPNSKTRELSDLDMCYVLFLCLCAPGEWTASETPSDCL